MAACSRVRSRGVGDGWADEVRMLLEAPFPAFLTTYRADASVLVSPVWYRWAARTFEIVVAEDDVKLRHLSRDPRSVLVVLESVAPFRGVEVRGIPELVEGDVTAAREAIAGRYLGVEGGKLFAAERRSKPGVLLRLTAIEPRVWNLSAILPD